MYIIKITVKSASSLHFFDFLIMYNKNIFDNFVKVIDKYILGNSCHDLKKSVFSVNL